MYFFVNLAGLSGNKSDPSGGDGPTIAVQSPSRAHLPPNTDVLNIDSLFGSPTSIIQQVNFAFITFLFKLIHFILGSSCLWLEVANYYTHLSCLRGEVSI